MAWHSVAQVKLAADTASIGIMGIVSELPAVVTPAVPESDVVASINVHSLSKEVSEIDLSLAELTSQSARSAPSSRSRH